MRDRQLFVVFIVFVVFVVAMASLGAPVWATTVGGSLTYGDLPLASTFSTMQSGIIQVRSIDGGTTTNYSLPFGDSYEIPVDLTPGEYRFWVMFTPRSGQTGFSYRSGDLFRSVGLVQVPDQTSFTLDVEMLFCPRVMQPLDSLQTWPGSGCYDCPFGAPQPVEFTLAWEPVPLATRYEVQIYRKSCAGSFVQDLISTTGLSAEITQLQGAGEEYIDVSVLAYDDADNSLSVPPLVVFSDECGRYAFAFNAVDQGRGVHTAGQIIPQVARVQGVGSSFWTTDLTLTNPTSVDVTTTMYYTPRDADGLVDYLEAEVTVPSGACRSWPDVVGSLLGTSGAGALEVRSTALVVASRTFTPASGGGAYGQGLMPIEPGQVLAAVGKKALGGGVMKAPGARSNLALNEVWGEQATAVVTLMDRDGTVLGTRQVALAPYSNHQVNDLAASLGGLSALAEGQVEVRFKSGTGRVAATLFLVDASDDPATVPLYALP